MIIKSFFFLIFSKIKNRTLKKKFRIGMLFSFGILAKKKNNNNKWQIESLDFLIISTKEEKHIIT